MEIFWLNVTTAAVIAGFGAFGLRAFRESRTHGAWALMCWGGSLYLSAIAVVNVTDGEVRIWAYRMVLACAFPLVGGFGNFVGAFTEDRVKLRGGWMQRGLMASLALLSAGAITTDWFIAGVRGNGMPAYGRLMPVFLVIITVSVVFWAAAIFRAWRSVPGGKAKERDTRDALHALQYGGVFLSLTGTFGAGLYTNVLRPMLGGDSSLGYAGPAIFSLAWFVAMSCLLFGAKTMQAAISGARLAHTASESRSQLVFDYGYMEALELMERARGGVAGKDNALRIERGNAWLAMRSGSGSSENDPEKLREALDETTLRLQESLVERNAMEWRITALQHEAAEAREHNRRLTGWLHVMDEVRSEDREILTEVCLTRSRRAVFRAIEKTLRLDARIHAAKALQAPRLVSQVSPATQGEAVREKHGEDMDIRFARWLSSGIVTENQRGQLLQLPQENIQMRYYAVDTTEGGRDPLLQKLRQETERRAWNYLHDLWLMRELQEDLRTRREETILRGPDEAAEGALRQTVYNAAMAANREDLIEELQPYDRLDDMLTGLMAKVEELEYEAESLKETNAALIQYLHETDDSLSDEVRESLNQLRVMENPLVQELLKQYLQGETSAEEIIQLAETEGGEERAEWVERLDEEIAAEEEALRKQNLTFDDIQNLEAEYKRETELLRETRAELEAELRRLRSEAYKNKRRKQREDQQYTDEPQDQAPG